MSKAQIFDLSYHDNPRTQSGWVIPQQDIDEDNFCYTYQFTLSNISLEDYQTLHNNNFYISIEPSQSKEYDKSITNISFEQPDNYMYYFNKEDDLSYYYFGEEIPDWIEEDAYDPSSVHLNQWYLEMERDDDKYDYIPTNPLFICTTYDVEAAGKELSHLLLKNPKILDKEERINKAFKAGVYSFYDSYSSGDEKFTIWDENFKEMIWIDLEATVGGMVTWAYAGLEGQPRPLTSYYYFPGDNPYFTSWYEGQSPTGQRVSAPRIYITEYMINNANRQNLDLKTVLDVSTFVDEIPEEKLILGTPIN